MAVPPRGGDRRADHREPRARPPSDAGAIIARLRATARKLGGGGDERLYGAGLVDAGAATAPGGPGRAARETRRQDRGRARVVFGPAWPDRHRSRCDLA